MTAWHGQQVRETCDGTSNHGIAVQHSGTTYAVIATALLASACRRADDRTALTADSALQRDLATATSFDRAPATDTIATIERTGGAVRPAAYRATDARSPRPAATVPQSPSAASGSGSGTSTAPAPRTVIVKHTARDAAIGAAAGAIIGATTSRDKVKGAVIGGVAGGIIGGVIGNNVDKQRKPVP